MYNPERYVAKNSNENIIEFVQKFPFATVNSVYGGESSISHLPLVINQNHEKLQLIGHMAKMNPQWKTFKSSQVTAIFHGPHTYITPMWYAENDVPTWNYSVAHLIGTAELIESESGIIECLKDLSTQTEMAYPSGWDFFIPDDLSGDVLTKAIIGFKINIEKIEFKKKLSQNKTDADRIGIMAGLKMRTDEQSRWVLNDMKKIYSNDGQKN